MNAFRSAAAAFATASLAFGALMGISQTASASTAHASVTAPRILTTYTPADSGWGGRHRTTPSDSGWGGRHQVTPADSGWGGRHRVTPADSGWGGRRVTGTATVSLA